MSLWTKFLNLFLTDMDTDGDDYFDFDRDLNQNFIKIDNALCSLQNGYNVFCVNSGIVDTDGLPAFLKLEGNTLKTVGSFDLTTAQGVTYTITDELTKDVSGLSDGEYNIFINPETKEIKLFKNKIYIDNKFPSEAAIGDYLLNIAKPPYDLEEKTASENLIGLKEVYAGSLTVSGGGGVVH